jgi:hypothetical protein
MEAALCLTPEDEKKIEGLVPGLKRAGPQVPTTFNDGTYADPKTSHPLLHAFGKRSGLKDSDWSMEYNRPDDSAYNAVMFKGVTSDFGDHAIADVVTGEIITTIGEKDAAVKALPDTIMTKGITEVFGSKFSCIDDLGSGIRTGAKGGQGILCQTLRKANDEYLAKLKTESDCKECQAGAKSEVQKLADDVKEVTEKELSESAKRGHDLVQGGKGRCLECHSRTEANKVRRTSAFLFIPSDKHSEDERKISLRELKAKAKEPDFLNDLETYLVSTKEMPLLKDGEKDNLSDSDRRDILEYVKTLAK